MDGFILLGRLYINRGGLSPVARKTADASGGKCDVLFEDVRAEDGCDEFGFTEYYPYSGGDRILFEDGRYELLVGGETLPAASVTAYRIHDGSKLTVNSDEQLNGRIIPFCDKVYPVGMNISECPHFEWRISAGDGEIPKILSDGNTETMIADGKETLLVVTYPADKNDMPREILTDFSRGISSGELRHGDRLELVYGGSVIRTVYWDALSKVWYARLDSRCSEMEYVDGGRYLMGDWRGLQYNYSFGSNNINMKKTWLNVLDPQFMGEEARGAAAAGVSGLRAENSSAAEKNSLFWTYNEDAVVLHEVEVSDFMLGKYQVTMERFYRFVDELEEISENALSYENGGERIVLNDVASFFLRYKKLCPRDIGWGFGQRPAVDVGIFEAVEYCNWLSRKEGLEPCYTFAPIYAGGYAEGKTMLDVFRPVKYSRMQRTVSAVAMQLCDLRCDFGRNGYRLPCEAETEYAMRGGRYMREINGGKGCLYAGMTADAPQNNIHYSWLRKNVDNPQKNGSSAADHLQTSHGGNGCTNPVGCKIPNQLGIYDLSGNVWELQWDVFNRSYYAECAANGLTVNPRGPVYSPQQKSIKDDFPTDKAVENEYLYSYEREADGSFRRTSARRLWLSGKYSPLLRGGCFTNPLPFTSSVHRHTMGNASYYNSFINSSNARIGFRLARSVQKGDAVNNA